jgi:DNA-binding response OmpR family regulator
MPLPPAARPSRVLIVEDHAPCAQIMKIALLAAGHEVLIARTIPTALAYVEEEFFSILVCDLLFPDGNGCDVIRAVREKNTDVFAVAVSGLPGEVCEREALEAGFNRFLAKPFLPHVLVELLA